MKVTITFEVPKEAVKAYADSARIKLINQLRTQGKIMPKEADEISDLELTTGTLRQQLLNVYEQEFAKEAVKKLRETY